MIRWLCVCAFLAGSRFQLGTVWRLMGRSAFVRNVLSLCQSTAQNPHRLCTVSSLCFCIAVSFHYVFLSLLQSHSFPKCLQWHICHFISSTLHFCLTLSADCCGCGKEFKNEQSLVALDKHWHLGCFKCKVCNKVLNAEYISKLVPLLLLCVRECVDGCLCFSNRKNVI